VFYSVFHYHKLTTMFVLRKCMFRNNLSTYKDVWVLSIHVWKWP